MLFSYRRFALSPEEVAATVMDCRDLTPDQLSAATSFGDSLIQTYQEMKSELAYFLNTGSVRCLDVPINYDQAAIETERTLATDFLPNIEAAGGDITKQITAYLRSVLSAEDFARTKCRVEVMEFEPGEGRSADFECWHSDLYNNGRPSGLEVPNRGVSRRWFFISGEPVTQILSVRNLVVQGLLMGGGILSEELVNGVVCNLLPAEFVIPIPVGRLIEMTGAELHRSTKNTSDKRVKRYLFSAELMMVPTL